MSPAPARKAQTNFRAEDMIGHAAPTGAPAREQAPEQESQQGPQDAPAPYGDENAEPESESTVKKVARKAKKIVDPSE